MTQSRKSIINQLAKRFETTIIGSLVRIEDNFGYLWAHNSDQKLTAQQQKFEDLWEFTRTSILNHGNKQMREAIDDVLAYLEQTNDELKYKLTLINQPQLTENPNKERKE